MCTYIYNHIYIFNHTYIYIIYIYICIITRPIAQETRRSYTAGECSAEQAMVQMIAVRVTTVRKLMHEKPEGRSNLRNEAPTEAENKSGY